MKKLIIIILFVFSFCFCFAADKKDEIPLLIKTDTVLQVPGINKAKIYECIKIWFAENMRNSNYVIQLDDRENAHIIGKCNLKFETKSLSWYALDGVIDFTIDVQAKDGRFRLKMYGFTHRSFNRQYGDSWDQGIIYANGIPDDRKGLKSKAYKEMRKRAIPLIIDCMAMSIATINVKIQSENSNNNNW